MTSTEELEKKLQESEKARKEAEDRRNHAPEPVAKDRLQISNEAKGLLTELTQTRTILEQLLDNDNKLLNEYEQTTSAQRSKEIVKQLEQHVDDYKNVLDVLHELTAKINEVITSKTVNLELERKALNKLLEEL